MPILSGPRSIISVSVKPAMRLAVGIAQIGGEQRKFRLAHALQENIGSEIIFMVAGREGIGRHQIGQHDRVLALVEAGEQGGRDHVAGMAIDDMAALGALGP